jgi:hypothetical protein
MQDHLVDIHRKIVLHQNQPDPFRTTTMIPFTQRVSGVATITVFDLHGNEIKTLLHEWRAAGDHRVEFDGEGFPEGLYLYRLTVDEIVKTKTMLLLRESAL